MLNKLIDDMKGYGASAMRQFVLLLVTALCALVAIGFLCAAGFIFLMDRYGVLNACYAGAGLFFMVGIICILTYTAIRRTTQRKAAQQKPSQLYSALSDPMILTAGLQATRMIGMKRLVPLMVIGGIALGLFSKRPKTDE